ncbi:hypothetical protein A3709_19305 [Halioglobus sp. HI00S01]|uniref:hypothetical protein n=1 Tax=Halioglobus sp. HI00S01 TaxID=1822214 RepID=UPI0007C2C23A|nr:hypothetical protein [Halioglobus sp. HI00S01]KZX57772.1 hypothetical protein A3709_19305 [Halioglobus sp. HI00S01]
MSAIVENQEVNIGDEVFFKADVEQTARIIEIEGEGVDADITVEAPEDGFCGNYIGRRDTYTLSARNCSLA